MSLAGYQRRYLRSVAHGLEALVHVGQSGLSANLLSSFDEALTKHELVKVRFVAFKERSKEIAAELATEGNAELISVVGSTALYYRAHPDAKRRSIQLPQR